MPSQRDLDCASMVRDALFPLKISLDGSHPTQFPASEALGKVRALAMKAEPNRAASSFFPRRVVVVRDISSPSELKWNGQPDVDQNDASVEALPNLLSVRSQHCGDGREAFVEPSDEKVSGVLRRIVLCSDRVMKRDYFHTKMPTAPRSLAKIEEVLAHHMTKVGEQLQREQQESSDPTSACTRLAAMEIRAARAAECYYGKAGSEVTRGSELGFAGYSLTPKSWQETLRNRCIRSVATRATEREFARVGRKCVAEAFDKANRD